MSTRRDREHEEAEPVVVETNGRVVTLVLDDGQEIELDRRELEAAIHQEGKEAT